MAVAMSAALGVVAIASVAIAGLGSLYAARAQAQIAADAAALASAVATYPPASATTPAAAATDVASQNGAAVVRCVCPPDASIQVRVVEVVTAIRADVPVFGEWLVRASSRAEFDPMRWLEG